MSDKKCRQRVAARVVSTLNQLIQPISTSDMVGFFTRSNFDAVENEVPHPLHVTTADMDGGESTETLATFILAWAAREGARRLLRAHRQG